MNILSYKRLFVVGFICLAGLVHLLHNQTFSLFLFPVLVATLLPYTYQPVWLTGSLILLAELLSTLPPGVMAIVIISPWLIRKIFSSVPIGISGTFYLLIGGTVAINLLILSIATLLSTSNLQLRNFWNYLPYIPIIQTFFATSLMAYALLILWDETIPRDASRRPSFIK